MDIKIDREGVIREFKKSGIVVIGKPVRLTSTQFSSVYIDLREKLYEQPILLWTVGGLIAEKIKEVATPGKKQRLIGIPEAGGPLAIAASLYAKNVLDEDIPIVVLRKIPKEHGTQVSSMISGKVDHDCEYNLIDDVITWATSKEKPIEQLKREGIIVKRVIVVIDREQGGGQIIKDIGYDFWAVFRLGDVLKQYLKEKLITPKQYNEVKKYIQKHQVV